MLLLRFPTHLWLAMGWLVLVGCSQPQGEPSQNEQPLTVDASRATAAGVAPSRNQSLGEIRRLIESGRLDAAEDALRKHLVRFNADTGARVLAAETYAAQGRIDDAIAMLRDAAQLTPRAGKSWRLQIASLQAGDGRWRQAIETLEQLVDEHPDFDAARVQLAGVLNQRGFRFDANEQVRELCRRGAVDATLLRGLMFPDRSFTGLDQKPDPGDAEQVRRYGALNMARAMYGEGEIAAAARLLSGSRLLEDRHPAAVAFLGQLRIAAGQFSQLPDWLQRAEPECRRYPAYWMAMGGWAMHRQRFESAARMFGEAIVREPGDLVAHDRITQALDAAGRDDLMEAFRSRGVEIDRLQNITRQIFTSPSLDVAAINELSRGLSEIGRQAESVAWFRIALGDRVAAPQVREQLMRATEMLGDAELTQRAREQVLCGMDLETFEIDERLFDETRARSALAGSSRWSPGPPRSKPKFVNVAQQVRLDFRYRNAVAPKPRYFLMHEQTGGGVACLDFDLDGWCDVYLAQASADPPSGRGTRPNRLARNIGQYFGNVTEPSLSDDRGYAGGVTAGDWNQDGFPDLLIANLGQNTLLINQGDGTFRRQRPDRNWEAARFTCSAAIGDVNGDALPDIVEINYIDDPTMFEPIKFQADGKPIGLPAPLHYRPSADRVFISSGDGSYRAEDLRGGAASPATGLGCLLTDLDCDGQNEIFVANDHLANQLWQRSGGGEADASPWRDSAAIRGLAFGTQGQPLGCMGIAAADFDRNERLDLHVTNFENEWSNQYMQNDQGYFEDRVVALGLDEPSYALVGFGTQAIDFDNNSVIDLIVGHGHIDDHSDEGRGFEMPTMLLAQQGGRFDRMPVEGDPGYWDAGHLTRALATFDWNRDGRTDFIATDLRDPVALLENQTPESGHWIQLRLIGVRCERDAIGTWVTVHVGSRRTTHWVQTGDGYMCKNESILSIGLDDASVVDRIEVRWPDGTRQTAGPLAADRRWLLVQDQEEPFECSSASF